MAVHKTTRGFCPAAAIALILPPLAIIASVAQGGPAGWNPLVAMVAAVAVVCLIAAIVARDRHLPQLVGVTALIAAMITFTVIGWIWRGPDWRLQYHPGPGRSAPHALSQDRNPSKGKEAH